jgi:putative Mn2+ efflux pump MntP
MSIIVISTCVFIISIVGSKIGNKFGDKYEHKAQIAGGIILILIGVKILLEHLGVF